MRGVAILGLGAVAVLGACAQIFSIEEARPGWTGADAGTTTGTTTTSTSSVTTTADGGCTPGMPVKCYDGPAATEGVGLCSVGMQMCGANGVPEGSCMGEVLPKAMDNCALMTDDNCDGVACSANVGGGVFDAGSVNGVAVDAMGNAFVAGTFSNTITFGSKTLVTAGGSDLFLAKIDPTGMPIWALSYGSVANETVSYVASTPDGGVILAGPLPLDINLGCGALSNASAKTDIFVAKINSDGSCQWSKVFGDTYGIGLGGIASNAKGDVVLAGDMYGSVSFGGAALPFSGMVSPIDFVAKLNATDGSQVWSRSLGDTSYGAEISVVTVDPAGDLILAGQNQSTGNSFDGGAHKPGKGMVVARFDTFGNYAWAFVATANNPVSYPSVSALAADPSGNIFLTGSPGLGVQFGQGAMITAPFIAKLDVNGMPQWSTGFSGTGTLSLSDLTVDGQGNIVLTGGIQGSVSFGGGPPIVTSSMQSFLVKLDGSTNFRWGKSFGSASSQGVGVTTVVATSQVVVAGNIAGSGQIDFGKGPLTCPGNDVFVATFEP